jgi:uncharacterized protein YjbI with pentapeptide repeats
MANKKHFELIRQGVDVWNDWRAKTPSILPDLRGANLNFAELSNAVLWEADLRGLSLIEAVLWEADLNRADLRGAWLVKADLRMAHLNGANLNGANLIEADLREADLRGANLNKATLRDANLNGADLRGANLNKATLREANLNGADLRWANLKKADLTGAALNANLKNTVLTGCRIHGISAWRVELSQGTKQQDLIITDTDEPDVTVDNIEVAQFIYLLLRNEKIRDVIDTIGKKGVLLLGRFTEGRIDVLKRLREELRQRGYVPIVFNFDKPETKDFTETVRLLAGLSHFVIADITRPKSAPLELQATVPEIMVPFQPIIQKGQEPFSMLKDLWIKHRDWVLKPIEYSSLDALVGALDKEIIKPAEVRFAKLLAKKAERMNVKRV